jgi:aminopeptidase N
VSIVRRRIGRTAAIFATAAAALAAAAAAWAAFIPGSPGLGDPFFPLAGNGGYNVANYSLRLDYTPATNQLVASEVITATATQDLASFDLDLRGFAITRLLVNGRPASYARDGQELKITPRRGIRSRASFTVIVAYTGEPTVVTDPDESIEGWVPTDDGAFVVGEPQGSPGWYAVNDNPRDKATYDFRVTVPAGLTAMANGVLVSQSTSEGKSTWVWREDDPMAPHLATVTNGRFDLTRYSLDDGTPVYIAVDPQLASGQALAKLPEMVKFFSSIYGPYPFDAVGAIVDSAPAVGYALETQTKPVFASVPSESTLAHELAHQWIGDSVTLAQWPDIWLHEGFARWSEWIWSEHEGNASAAQRFEQLYSIPASNDAFWNPPPGNPGTPALLFDGTVYTRGAMTLEALREKVGDTTFFRILREWAQRNRFRNVTTARFVAFAGRVSGMNLQHFFDVWLYQPGKPTSW